MREVVKSEHGVGNLFFTSKYPLVLKYDSFGCLVGIIIFGFPAHQSHLMVIMPPSIAVLP